MNDDTAALKTRLTKILYLPSSMSDDKIVNLVTKLMKRQATEARIKKLIKVTNMTREDAIRTLKDQDAASASNK
jgi:hypothetical protein